MDNCIFCKIIAGSIPADVILETEAVIAFMDINPAVPGHALIVPKRHSVDVTDAGDDDLAAVAAVAKRVGILQKRVLAADGFNIVSATGRAAQQSVFHTHFHVVPRFEGDGLNIWFHGAVKQPLSKEAFEKLRRG